MKVLDSGHSYELDIIDNNFDEPMKHYLTFVKREGINYPGNIGHHPGVIIQEVLRCLIHRLKYVNNQIPSEFNQLSINVLRQVLYNLECRAALRHGKEFSLTYEEIDTIETLPVGKNGHLLKGAGTE